MQCESVRARVCVSDNNDEWPALKSGFPTDSKSVFVSKAFVFLWGSLQFSPIGKQIKAPPLSLKLCCIRF